MKKKNGSSKKTPARTSDGRGFITVYVKPYEHAKISAHVEELEEKDPMERKVGMSKFMRLAALKAIAHAGK